MEADTKIWEEAVEIARCELETKTTSFETDKVKSVFLIIGKIIFLCSFQKQSSKR